MEQSTILFLSIVVLVINLIVFYFLIRAAVLPITRNDLLCVQTRLLCKLLLQNGVSINEIKDIVDQGKDHLGNRIDRDYQSIIPGLDREGKPNPVAAKS